MMQKKDQLYAGVKSADGHVHPIMPTGTSAALLPYAGVKVFDPRVHHQMVSLSPCHPEPSEETSLGKFGTIKKVKS